MKIGNFEINFGFVKNEQKNESGSGRVVKKITSQQLIRSKSQIKDWTDATNRAESKIQPDRTELIRTYQNIVVDSHLSSVMQTLKLNILNANWNVVDANGKTSDSVGDFLSSQWFRKILEYYVDSLFYGYSLIQIGDIIDGKPEIEIVPREYVVPEFRAVKTKLNETSRAKMISIDDMEYQNYLIFSNVDLGILHKAAPIVIMKRAVMSAWSEYAEIFGMPIRIGKTDIRDPNKFKNMDNMLANMGSAAYGVFDPSDMIEFIQASGTDAFEVFNQFMNKADQQISKLFLGQTGTTDEKSFAGSAGVHNEIFKSIVQSHIENLIYFVNDCVFPKLVELKLIPDNFRIVVVGENEVAKSLGALSPLVANKILESMTVNEIRDLIGLAPDDTIEKKKPIPSVANLVSKLYAEDLHNELTNELE